MHKRSILAALLMAALWLGGCASDETGSVPTTTLNPPPLSSRTLVLETSSADLPADVTTFRFSGRDAADRPVFGPVTQPRASTVTVSGLPAQLTTLQIEGLRSPAGELLADYVTSLEAREGQTVLVNPPFLLTADTREQSFVVLGCNRLQYEDQQITPSSANSAQLIADFQEIPQRFNPRPSYVFFTGDLVMAENHAPLLQAQLTDWIVLWKSISNGLPLAALPGNHEMLFYDTTINDEVPDPPCGEVWTSLMAPYIPASDGPTQAPPNLDNLQRDESRLSYTFRTGSACHVCLNTETWEGGLTPADTGKVPLHWLREKLSAAEADPSVRDIFVYGHKPVFVLGNKGDEVDLNPTQAIPFYALLNASPKVRAYVCAHAHRWQYGVPGDAPAGSTLPQLVAGNAGSDLDKVFKPGYFGYTLIHVAGSGRITAESWGRPVPTPYSHQGPQPATTIRERFTLYRGAR